jgi:dTDP-4-amino-4,6-dideoxygalactose transaminase
VAGARHIYNQYVIRVPADLRDSLRSHLGEHRIGCEVYYPVPLHMQECFAWLGQPEGTLPESERAARETLALPVYPEMTETQQRHVVDTIVAYLREHAGTTAVRGGVAGSAAG